MLFRSLHHSYKSFKSLYSSRLSHRATQLKELTSPFSRPADTHTKPSSLILRNNTSHEGWAPSKTMAFLCFHSSRIVSPRMVRRSFMLMLFSPRLLHNQGARMSCCVGTQSGRPRASQITFQTVLAKTHVSSRWLIVTCSWSQKGHASWCGSPRHARRSEVQHRSQIGRAHV